MSERKPVTIEAAVGFLNELVDTDAEALAKLIDYRVECSDDLGEHPTIQVGHIDYDPANPLEVGMLGILNGLFGIHPDGGGWIAARFDVTCPKGHAAFGRAGDKCHYCDETLQLGKLLGFAVWDQ